MNPDAYWRVIDYINRRHKQGAKTVGIGAIAAACRLSPEQVEEILDHLPRGLRH